VKKTL